MLMKQLGYIGLPANADFKEYKYIILCNIVSWLGLTGSITFAAFHFAYFGPNLMALGSGLAAVGFVVPLLFNYKRKWWSARFFLGAYMPTVITAASILVKRSYHTDAGGIETQYFEYRFYFLVAVCVVTILYDRNKRWASEVMLMYIFLNIALFDLIHNYFGVGYYQTGHTDAGYYFSNAAVILCFFGIVTIIMFLRESMALADQSLEKKIVEVEYKNLEIQKTARQLETALRSAEESNRLKSFFLGSLSHEIRTPLQGIHGFAEILESPALPLEKRREYLSIIKRRANDMQGIIDSLLDIAMVESGEIKPIPAATNLNEFAEFFFAKLKLDYPLEKPLSLKLINKLEPDATVQLDPQHLSQVLLNLFRNAVKFTNEGSITLSYQRQGDYFIISMADTGIGISNEKLTYIFEPFRQAHEGISRSKGGIGLGLSISKRLVELWGGQLRVESSPGNGSTFYVSIPAHAPPAVNLQMASA